MNRVTTALELFKEFRRKEEFRRCPMAPAGFARGLEQDFLFHFYPGRDGWGGWQPPRYPSLDTRKAKFYCDVRFDGTDSPYPMNQLINGVWQAILAGPLAGRVFYADPAPKDLRCDYLQKTMDIVFSVGGEPVEGLKLDVDGPPLRSLHWEFFVPEGTPENVAIRAALEYERATCEVQRATQKKPDLDRLAAQARVALETVL